MSDPVRTRIRLVPSVVSAWAIGHRGRWPALETAGLPAPDSVGEEGETKDNGQHLELACCMDLEQVLRQEHCEEDARYSAAEGKEDAVQRERQRDQLNIAMGSRPGADINDLPYRAGSSSARIRLRGLSSRVTAAPAVAARPARTNCGHDALKLTVTVPSKSSA